MYRAKPALRNSFEIFYDNPKLEFFTAVAVVSRMIGPFLNKTRKLMSMFVVQANEAQ
jgi:hypothetical protein